MAQTVDALGAVVDTARGLSDRSESSERCSGLQARAFSLAQHCLNHETLLTSNIQPLSDMTEKDSADMTLSAMHDYNPPHQPHRPTMDRRFQQLFGQQYESAFCAPSNPFPFHEPLPFEIAANQEMSPIMTKLGSAPSAHNVSQHFRSQLADRGWEMCVNDQHEVNDVSPPPFNQLKIEDISASSSDSPVQTTCESSWTSPSTDPTWSPAMGGHDLSCNEDIQSYKSRLASSLPDLPVPADVYIGFNTQHVGQISPADQFSVPVTVKDSSPAGIDGPGLYGKGVDQEYDFNAIPWLGDTIDDHANQLSHQMAIMSNNSANRTGRYGTQESHFTYANDSKHLVSHNFGTMTQEAGNFSGEMFLGHPEAHMLPTQSFMSTEPGMVYPDLPYGLHDYTYPPASTTPSNYRSSPIPPDRNASSRKRNQTRHPDLDETLVKLRKQGMSYKDIMKVGNWGLEESTLRGRYRTLTKSKEQRVRKPKWDRDAEEALVDAVEALAPQHHPRTATSLGKVPWKKVAEWMHHHRDCYLYGNATVKKKYMEIVARQTQQVAWN